MTRDGAPCTDPTATIDMSTGQCQCLICARCNQHTGNSHQGHYWSTCQVTHTHGEHHFCCPGNCELGAT